ncbi:MAG: hypothetical protein AB7F86_08385 [Bdellovibrionales bacterium]
MVTLPGLESYSTLDLAAIRQRSPAFARYEFLVKQSEIPVLHRLRHEAWLRAVAATYTGSVGTAGVCQYWSQVADDVLSQAWTSAGLHLRQAALFAFGKLGAEELNLSSDVDLLFVAEPAELPHIEGEIRDFLRALQNTDEFGFCYRVDLDLRPGGKLGPILTTPDQFQDYYWSQGAMWERLALIRLRPITSAPDLADRILTLAQKFTYRKFLDFTLFEELKQLRGQVHQFGFVAREDQLHLKLGVGGIRDIELFVHSMLVLHGGKFPGLRTRSTTMAIDNLIHQRLLREETGRQLKELYWRFRQLENEAQASQDLQVHSIPLDKEVAKDMGRADQIVSDLLGGVNLSVTHLPHEPEDQERWLIDLGIPGHSIKTTWPSLIQATALSYKSDRDERARREFLFVFIQELAKQPAANRDLGLNILADFVRAMRAKASFFTLLLGAPRLIQDLARIFCQSPYLGAVLAARPELLDLFVLGLGAPWMKPLDELMDQMRDRKLLSEIWAANAFLANGQLPELYSRCTKIADEITSVLADRLKEEFPQAQVEILTMGKWGGRELGLRSDLDFVFVTPQPPTEDDLKVARRFISRLSDLGKAGTLYDIDLRLRPSGQSGPLLCTADQLVEFWSERAEPWERQAYLRARPLTDRLKVDKSLLVTRGLETNDREELARIRSKLLRPNQKDKIDIKFAPGGLVDIEFLVQISILHFRIAEFGTSTSEMIEALAHVNEKWRAEASEMNRIYDQLRRFEQILQLAAATKLHVFTLGSDSMARAASLLKRSEGEAWDDLHRTLLESQAILKKLDVGT